MVAGLGNCGADITLDIGRRRGVTDRSHETKKDQMMLAQEMAMQRKSHCSCCRRNWPDR
jgi:hypothetical protein